MSAKPYSMGFMGIFTIGRYFTFLLINSHVLPLESGKFLTLSDLPFQPLHRPVTHGRTGSA